MDPEGHAGGNRSFKTADTTLTKDHAIRRKPTLPPHILAMIFGHLMPKVPIASNHRGPPNEKSTYSPKYRDLINVSRACRQFHALAKPLLLKNVALPSKEVMCKFMEMLWRNPENRKHIRHLCFQFPVNKETSFSLTPMQLEHIRNDVRARPDGQSVKDAILSILGAEEGQSRHGSGSSPIWIAYSVHVLSMCPRLESLEIRLFTPWCLRVNLDGDIGDVDLTEDVGNRILWDFLLRTGRLPVGDMGPDSSQLAKDNPPSSWLPQHLRKVTVVFKEPQLPYDEGKDDRIELDVVPNNDRLVHTKIMREVEEWVGSSSIFHNSSTHNVPDSRLFLTRLLIEPERIPHLGADEYRRFRFYLDRLKNIHFLQDMKFGEYIDRLQGLAHVSGNARKGDDTSLGHLDLAKHREFCRAYGLLALFPDTSEHLTVSAMHGHLRLFDFLLDSMVGEVDEYGRFEDNIDALKMRSLTLTHTRKQSEKMEKLIHEKLEGDVVRRLFLPVDTMLHDYPNLRALHLPLFLSDTLSEQAYIHWSEKELRSHDGFSYSDEEWVCLSEHKALKELTMTFSGMTGSVETEVDVNSLEDFFHNCLPPTLETLNLLDWWSWYYDFYNRISHGDEHEQRRRFFARCDSVEEFLKNLAKAIVSERWTSLKSLKRLKICYMDEGPGKLFSSPFVGLKERCWMWKFVDQDLGIELVFEPYQCEVEHFGPFPWRWR